MNAPQAILAQASLFAQEVYQTEPTRSAFPWFWVIIAIVASVSLVWYFAASRTRGGGPPTIGQ
jgi:threonine/homoserine/homoserine lactone efflux protein